MINRIMRVAVLLSFVAVGPRLHAQVTGLIQDPAAAPIADAIVELWAPTERLAVTTTSSSGRFQFPLQEQASGLWIRRIGFRARHFSLSGTTTDAAIVLTPLPLKLGDLSTRVTALCPHKEEPEARALMRSLVERYSHRLDSVGIFTWFWLSSGRVETPGLEVFDTTRMGYGQTGGSGGGARLWSRSIETEGYALKSLGGMGQRYDGWDYVRLDGGNAHHFADPFFVNRHRFFRLVSDDANRRIGFCPEDRDHPVIEGILEVGPEPALVRATWVYRTPKPMENAGGEVTFVPPSATEQRPLLLAATGLYWRKLWTGSYYQEWAQYDTWVIGSSDSVPFRPRRASK